MCGRCARFLEDTPSEGQVDQAADEHVAEAHPDAERTVVIPASEALAQEATGDLLEIAVRAQLAAEDGTGDQRAVTRLDPGSPVGDPSTEDKSSA